MVENRSISRLDKIKRLPTCSLDFVFFFLTSNVKNFIELYAAVYVAVCSMYSVNDPKHLFGDNCGRLKLKSFYTLIS